MLKPRSHPSAHHAPRNVPDVPANRSLPSREARRVGYEECLQGLSHVEQGLEVETEGPPRVSQPYGRKGLGVETTAFLRPQE